MADDIGDKWSTMFDRMNAKDAAKDMKDLPDIDKVLSHGGKKDKKLSVERIYQKKTQLEHILLRPDTYIGSIEKVTQPMWVWDDEEEMMVSREITFVPGLYKIFDEILVNAADNKQRDKNMSQIKIDIDPENNKIKIWNNGKGIPVVEHKTEKVFVPTLIFGHLLTSSNYDDSEKKVTGGRNGYGAKLCNIFSTKFTVETQSNEYKRAFRQTWTNNMGKATEPKLSDSRGDDYTCITYQPDLSKFGMESLDKDTVALFTRRAYDIAAASGGGVKVFLNGKKLPIKNFKDYIDLYIKKKVDDNDQPLKVVYEKCSDRWEVAVTLSEKGFQQVSFVNSIATTKGGRHVDNVTDQMVSKLIEVIKKKEKKGGMQIKPFQVKTHLWVFVNCLIENPTFDSQTKENMTLQAKNFGSKCSLTDKFITQMSKCGVVESIQSWMKFKQQEKLSAKHSSKKQNKLKGIPKLDDANDAGTKNSMHCSLILTEGDSAKTLAVSGLGVVGRDHYGVFPLRGKLLNVREATHKQILENAEINNIVKIVGLRYKEKYDSPDTLKTLRYGKIMIMTDQDQDGSHIKGLLINFIHHNWPNLLKHNFVEEFITPIVKVSKNKQEHSFYSLPEFEEWKSSTDKWHTWKVKYYKGLGTSTSKEAKEYFHDMNRHRIPFRYAGTEDDASIVLAFSKKKADERKEWLTNWMEERKRRSQLGLPELYLYGKDTRYITYNEFVNRELILFSNMDLERSIPSMVDGFKPGQRKVMYACFKRNLIKELKVAQLAGSVAEVSAYHHGEMSLMGTIINLAQNFIGSNNLNLLQPIGQFGTRLHGGKDAASPRYIFTMLSPLARLLFSAHDDALLKYTFDDNQRTEPVWYLPIIPMVLVNGADGIGTGWSTKIPNFDVREIVRQLLRLLDDEELQPMIPSYKNFKGTIDQLEYQRYAVSGEISIIDDNQVEITELPVKTWTQNYKESVLEVMLGTGDKPAQISDFKEYHTDTTVKFVVTMPPEKLRAAEEQGLHKFFKLQNVLNTSCMVLFDQNGCIKRYASVEDVLKEFYELRLEYYQKRKDYLEGILSAESLRLDNQARFICEKIEGKISIENKPKKEMIQTLVRNGYDSDPVKAWKEAQNKLEALQNGVDESDDEEDEESTSGPDYNYILGMPLWSLTRERKEDLLKQRDAKSEELYQLKRKSSKDLWRDDLDKFVGELEALEERERLEEEAGAIVPVKGPKGRSAKPKKFAVAETKPSPYGRRVEPKIDASLKAKSAAAAAKKLKKEKSKKEINFDDIDEDSNEPKGLADRLGDISDILSPSPAKKKAAPKEKKEKQPKKPKEKKTSEKGSPKKKGKGGKKKNPWSSDDEDNVSISGSDDNFDASFTDIAPARDKPKRATKQIKYNFDESDEGKPFSDSDDSLTEMKVTADAAPEPKRRSPSPPARNNHDDDSDFDFGNKSSDDDDFNNSVEQVFGKKSEPAKSKPAPKPKARSPSPINMSDSDSDREPLFPSKPAEKPKAVSKPKSKPKPKARSPSVSISDSDSDREPLFPSKPAEKPKAAPKPIAFDSDSDDGIFPPKPAEKKEKAPAKKKLGPKKTAEDKPKKPKAAPKRKKKDSDLDLSDDDFGEKKKPAKKPKAKSTAAKKKKTFVDMDSDDEFEADDMDVVESAPAPRPRGGRGAAKAVKYNFGESDDDDDDDWM